MNVSTVMDQIGTALATITGLRVFDFPSNSAVPPFAIVDYPDMVEYDSTMVRGSDEATFPVLVAVSKVSDRVSRDKLAAYLDGSGAKSVKAAVDAGSVGQSRRVVSAEVSEIVVGGTPYIGAVFQVHVIA